MGKTSVLILCLYMMTVTHGLPKQDHANTQIQRAVQDAVYTVRNTHVHRAVRDTENAVGDPQVHRAVRDTENAVGDPPVHRAVRDTENAVGDPQVHRAVRDTENAVGDTQVHRAVREAEHELETNPGLNHTAGQEVDQSEPQLTFGISSKLYRVRSYMRCFSYLYMD